MAVKQVQKEMILFLPVWIFTCTIGIAMYVNISILLSLFFLNIYFGDRVLTIAQADFILGIHVPLLSSTEVTDA